MTKDQLQAENDRLRAENTALRELVTAVRDDVLNTVHRRPKFDARHYKANLEVFGDRLAMAMAMAAGMLNSFGTDTEGRLGIFTDIIRKIPAEITEQNPYRYENSEVTAG